MAEDPELNGTREDMPSTVGCFWIMRMMVAPVDVPLVEVDAEAHLLAIPMRHGQKLKFITLEAVANDIVFGLMGATILADD